MIDEENQTIPFKASGVDFASGGGRTKCYTILYCGAKIW